MTPIRIAIAKVGASALARILKTKPNGPLMWAHRDNTPADVSPQIELATGGEVTADELCPGTRWKRIKDRHWPHPKGRPLIDPAGPAPKPKRSRASA